MYSTPAAETVPERLSMAKSCRAMNGAISVEELLETVIDYALSELKS